MHSSNDVCFGLELVRDEKTGSCSDSESVASSGYSGDRGQQTHLVNLLLGKSCVQVCDVVDDICLVRNSLCSNFVVGIIKLLKIGRHQDRVAEDVTIVTLPEVC